MDRSSGGETSGGKETEHRIKGDTEVDGRRYKIEWTGRYSGGWIKRWRDFEIQRYRDGGKETLRCGENAVLRPLIEDPALAGGEGGERGPKARYYETLEPH